jgi:hypothetical protein
MGISLWTSRAQGGTRPRRGRPDPRPRVDAVGAARRRAGGVGHRDVATALFIGPKTVEANLARIYRKLGIKTRAELGRMIGDV